MSGRGGFHWWGRRADTHTHTQSEGVCFETIRGWLHMSSEFPALLQYDKCPDLSKPLCPSYCWRMKWDDRRKDSQVLLFSSFVWLLESLLIWRLLHCMGVEPWRSWRGKAPQGPWSQEAMEESPSSKQVLQQAGSQGFQPHLFSAGQSSPHTLFWLFLGPSKVLAGYRHISFKGEQTLSSRAEPSFKPRTRGPGHQPLKIEVLTHVQGAQTTLQPQNRPQQPECGLLPLPDDVLPQRANTDLHCQQGLSPLFIRQPQWPAWVAGSKQEAKGKEKQLPEPFVCIQLLRTWMQCQEGKKHPPCSTS